MIRLPFLTFGGDKTCAGKAGLFLSTAANLSAVRSAPLELLLRLIFFSTFDFDCLRVTIISPWPTDLILRFDRTNAEPLPTL